MALFGSSKKKEEKAVAVKGAAPETAAPKASVLIGPRITEKSALLSEKGVYIFDIVPTANKRQVSHAIKLAHKVTPVKINISVTKPKKVFVRGKVGYRQGGKKAMVTLKKGQTIEFA